MCFLKLNWIILLNVFYDSLIFQLISKLYNIRIVLICMLILKQALVYEVVYLVIEHYTLLLLRHSEVEDYRFCLLLATSFLFIIAIVKLTKSDISVLLEVSSRLENSLKHMKIGELIGKEVIT